MKSFNELKPMKKYCLVVKHEPKTFSSEKTFYSVDEFSCEDEIYSDIKMNRWYDLNFFIFQKIESEKLELEKARVEGEILGRDFSSKEFIYDGEQNYRANEKIRRYELYLSLKKEFEK